MKKVTIAQPYVTASMRREVQRTLKTRWIGEGPKVKEFESQFKKKFKVKHAIAVNSGTAALELAYDLLHIGPGDEVITTPFTCTATNLPLVRRGATLVFADIKKDTLTIDPEDIERKITERTKAVVVVDIHGVKATRGPFYYIPDRAYPAGANIPVVVDTAQALGNTGGDYATYSFQAIKHVTTGDGGMLVVNSDEDEHKARLWRWFGVDREKKLHNNWQPYKNRAILFDIDYPGYKFHMNDIAAGMGIKGLEQYDKIFKRRKDIFQAYKNAGLPMVDGPDNKYGYACLLTEHRDIFAEYMDKHGIETNLMHVRNDAYMVFKPYETSLPNMDWVDSRYICIPLHNVLTNSDVKKVIKTASIFFKHYGS